MTGEQKLWMKLAGHISEEPESLKSKKTISELTLWDEYFKLEWTEPSPDQWYLAQIAFQLYLLRASLPFSGFKPEAKMEAFLLKFRFDAKTEEKKRYVPGTPVERSVDGRLITEERMKKIKAKESQLEAIVLAQKKGSPKKAVVPRQNKPKKKGGI